MTLRLAPVFGLILLSLTAIPASAQAPSCKPEDFGAAVDGAGAALRAYNGEAAPKLQARIKALAAGKGWNEQETDETAIAYLQDDRITKLDETANSLLAKIDTLGRLDPGQSVDCAKLDELKTAGIELLAVMKAKSTYIMSKIDIEVATRTAAASTAAPPVPLKDTVVPAVPATQPPPAVAKGDPAPPKKPVPAPTWATTTAPHAPPPAASSQVAMLPPPVPAPVPPTAAPDVPRPSEPMAAPPPATLVPDDGYTIDEIRDATRGFFGTVSTGLAAVIEHAFASSGRPTGYILGQEGGGAFLGGLRYGDGLLYVRTGGTQKIFWHGPSVGLDVGAAGARTMFLIYKMTQPDDLFRVFTGVDGSAFVVGGVGLTLLGGGGMLLAPIRSGLGVRVGANIGYLRFTPTQTWNPF